MSACQPVDGACGGEPVTSRPVVPDGVTKIIVGPGQSGSTAVDRCLSPVSICNVAQEKQCKMKVTFYPQGFYTTSLWNGQLNLAKSTDQTKLVIAHRGGLELSQAEVSVVVYAQQNGVKYASFAISAAHTFETYGSFEIENTIDTEQLKVEGSEFLLDGAVQVKVFVRPISFNRNSIN